MKNQSLYKLFIQELEDMYDSEHQVLDFLPKMISRVYSGELKDALAHHLKETEDQVVRLKKIFALLSEQTKGKTCEAMKGIFREAQSMIGNKTKSALLDAAIISAAQKIEHYEIASYGTLRSFAKHLGCESEIIKLLQETLDEETSADKKLTKTAEGSVFSSGINEEAAEASHAQLTGAHK